MRKNRIGKGICPGAAWVIAVAIAGCATGGAKVAKIHQSPQAYENKEVQITGQVTQVCQGKGCWIEVEQGGAKLIARSVDHKITFPKDCAGRKVTVRGLVRVDQKHQCGEEHPETSSGQVKEKGHACPSPQVFLELTSATLR